MMVQAQQEQGKGSAMPTDPQHIPTVIQPSTSQPQLKQRSRRPKIKDTEVPQPSGPTDNVTDEVVYKEMDDSLERAATTTTSLDAEQDRQEDASKQGRIADIDADAGINLVSTHFDADTDMFGVYDLVGNEADKVMLQEPEQGIITTTTTATTVTAASTRPKAKGLVIHE
ncbi:hypothetical protein Tco_0744083 [Tanacetum coccineum]